MFAETYLGKIKYHHMYCLFEPAIQSDPPWLICEMIVCRRGLVDELGAEAMMIDALDKVEKELKKPLLRNDKKGMALLKAEFDKVNQK